MIYERLMIASRLREARLRRGLTQLEVAAKCFVCQRQLIRIEKGQRDVPASLLLGLCRLYGVEPNEMMNWG